MDTYKNLKDKKMHFAHENFVLYEPYCLDPHRKVVASTFLCFLRILVPIFNIVNNFNLVYRAARLYRRTQRWCSNTAA